MNRNSFIALLVRAVQDRLINESKASELLRAFDSGEIKEIDFPLTVAETAEPLDRTRMRLALAGLLLFLGLRRDSSLPRYSGLLQRRTLESLIDRFKTQARSIAAQYGALQSVSLWQGGMVNLIADTILQARMLGESAPLADDALLSIASVITTQSAFLSRFADKMAVSRILGSPLSVAAIASRSENYAGAARAQFFAGAALSLLDSGRIYFISQDDGGTCGNCLEADAGSPYAVGDAVPLPGEICLGGGRCRCYLEAA
jgi:hypothetical protein